MRMNTVPRLFYGCVYGTISWDSPGAVGEYNIAFHVIEWRFKNGQWVQMGYVRRGSCKFWLRTVIMKDPI